MKGIKHVIELGICGFASQISTELLAAKLKNKQSPSLSRGGKNMQSTDARYSMPKSESQQHSTPVSRAVAAQLTKEQVRLLPFNPADHDLSWKCLAQIKLNRNDIDTIRRNLILAIGVNTVIGLVSYIALKYLNLN